MIEEEGTFVVLLIGGEGVRIEASSLAKHSIPDEVESLTAARAGAMSGNEPSDALRVS